MGRPRKFDEARAVDAAMRVFWATGYEATSTQELCEATGLGRSSIYNTFRSKHDLFTRALRRYVEITSERLTGLLGADLPVRVKLHRLLDAAVDDAVEVGRDGCLGVNTAVELSTRDPEVDRLLRRDAEWRIQEVRAVIEAGQRDGDVDAGRDAAAMARYVFTMIGALRLRARSGAERAELQGIADVAKAAL